MSDRLQFRILPYISVNDDIEIFDVIIWSFNKYKEYLKDNEIRGQLELYFKQYRHYNQNSVPLNISVVSYKDKNNFTILSPTEDEYIEKALLGFFFSTIIRNNQISARTSNDFLLYTQNFIKGENDIAIQSGSIVQKTDGGYEVDEILFIQPFNVSPSRPLQYDEALLFSFCKLLHTRNKKRIVERIFNTLEWISYAYSNNDNFEYSSRIVMMMTAFEFLFNGIDDKFDFMTKINKTIKHRCDSCARYYSKRKIWIKDGIRKIQEHHFKEWWAYDFYTLRSKIVHGNKISSNSMKNRKGKSFFLLSIQMIEQCIKRILEQENVYSYSFLDSIKCAELYDQI